MTFKNIEKTQLRWFGIGLFVCATLFVSLFFYHQFFTEDKTLKFEDAINLRVTHIHRCKGSILLNDSIAMHANLKRINPYVSKTRYMEIGSINEPYQILKEPNSDSIFVLKDFKILIYRLNPKSEHWFKILFKSQ